MKAFFDSIRSSLFGGSLKPSVVTSINAILSRCSEMGVTNLHQQAYILATVYHEVGPGMVPKGENLNYSAQGLARNWPTRYALNPKAATKQPNALALRLAHKPEAIANNCYASRMGNADEASGDGWRYRGRDFCQTTGKSNYERAGKYSGLDLVAHPERIAELPVAANTLVVGMRDGWSTGVRLSRYIKPGSVDFISARRIINGTDKAQKVAAYANKFLTALQA